MKVLSIMQPAYLPWVGYFDRIARADVHCVLDHVQFEKNSFTNRNYICGQNGPTMLTIPIKTAGKFGNLQINSLHADEASKWRRKHLSAIQQAYGRSVYFDDFYPAIERAINDRGLTFFEVVESINRSICDFLAIDTWQTYSSSLNAKYSKSDLVLEICQNLGCDTYLSGGFGRKYLDLPKFKKCGVKVIFHDEVIPPVSVSEVYPSIIHSIFHHGMGALGLLETVKKAQASKHELLN